MDLVSPLLFFVVSSFTIGTTLSKNVNETIITTNKTIKEFAEPKSYAFCTAVIKGRDELSTAVIITKRFLVSGANFMKRHDIKRVSVLTGLHQKEPNKHKIEKIFLAPNNSMALIKLEKDIKFNEAQKPIPLLMKNELNLNLQLQLKEGTKELKVFGYVPKLNAENNSIESIPLNTSLHERMKIDDLSQQNFTIHSNAKLDSYNSGACLIINGKFAGVGSDTQPFIGNFAGIPHHFKWISDIVGYKNLKEAFLQMYPGK